MASSGFEMTSPLDKQRAAFAADETQATRIARWSSIVMYGVAIIILGLVIVIDGIPGKGQLLLWTLVLLAIGLVPIDAGLMVAAARKHGIQIRHMIIPPFSVVVERDTQRRLRWGLHWFASSRSIMPTESTVDQYIAVEREISLAGHTGDVLKASLMGLVAMAIVIWSTAPVLFVGMLVIGALWTLKNALINIRFVLRSRTYIRELPELRSATSSLLRANVAIANGKRPREVELKHINGMLESQPGTAIHLAGLVTAATCLLDRGDVERADHLMQDALKATNRGFGYLHYIVFLNAAYFAASVRHDPVVARKHMQKATGMSTERHLPRLIEATILQREGRMAEARMKAQSGLELIPKAVNAGCAKMDHERLEEIIAASDRHLAEAFAQEVIARRQAAKSETESTP